MFARGELVVSLPFLLEAGYSARRATDHSQLLDKLEALPRAVIDSKVEQRALDAQRQLTRSGHHRTPPAGLILAALADRDGVGILHYDRDYDLIRDRTDLRYESVWLAEPGAL
jgi:predicted nucleic acid-binding protein